MTLFGGILLGGSNTKKRGDHQNKKVFINKSAKALIAGACENPMELSMCDSPIETFE